ncbi:hypothetical protein Taro_000652 [Colocasia esculenta]|uniref:Uncharacterized protein n=1 Tax=Colocasia esculenta TaxID=4460 RepID=A0A843T7L7_COLES|nr:hypothetical protein [Colocasia esculenta]
MTEFKLLSALFFSIHVSLCTTLFSRLAFLAFLRISFGILLLSFAAFVVFFKIRCKGSSSRLASLGLAQQPLHVSNRSTGGPGPGAINHGICHLDLAYHCGLLAKEISDMARRNSWTLSARSGGSHPFFIWMIGWRQSSSRLAFSSRALTSAISRSESSSRTLGISLLCRTIMPNSLSGGSFRADANLASASA